MSYECLLDPLMFFLIFLIFGMRFLFSLCVSYFLYAFLISPSYFLIISYSFLLFLMSFLLFLINSCNFNLKISLDELWVECCRTSRQVQ